MPTDNRARARVTLSGVRDAYFRGDFERVLTMADALPARDAFDVVESALLRARALLTLGRAEEALGVLRALRLVDRPQDEYLTAQTLTAVAFSKLDQDARAVEMLRAVHASAAGAHPIVRAEIALNLGITHYRLSEHADAVRLLSEVPPEADIVYAQALEYRAWSAYATGEYEHAAALFDEALATITRCRHYDRFVDATTLRGLAMLAAELPRLDRWPEIQARVSSIDWSAAGLDVSRFWLAAMSSIIEEMRGDRGEAVRWASVAEEVAPNGACRVAASCRLAAVTGRYGEAYAHQYFVRRARRAYDELPRDAAFRAEHFLALTVAEEIAAGDAPLEAAPLLIFHREVVEPLARRRPEHAMLTAVRDGVEARLEHARGNHAGAVRRYARAFESFTRRVTVAVLRSSRCASPSLPATRATGNTPTTRCATPAMRIGSRPRSRGSASGRQRWVNGIPRFFGSSPREKRTRRSGRPAASRR
jgi:tetratricopeptide (TPR) repeat protein